VATTIAALHLAERNTPSLSPHAIREKISGILIAVSSLCQRSRAI
jgi:hypothetical protein